MVESACSVVLGRTLKRFFLVQQERVLCLISDVCHELWINVDQVLAIPALNCILYPKTSQQNGKCLGTSGVDRRDNSLKTVS